MKKILKQKTAFSLFELSIVLVLIAIIVGGISEGSALILKSRLASAGRLTQNSEIEKTNDLVAWFETSSPDSFSSDSLENATPIASWQNRAVNNVNLRHALQINATNQPILINHAINKALPALQFSGNQWLSFANADFNNSSYTIFIVEQRNSGANDNFFISSQGSGAANFLAGYSSSNNLRFIHGSTNINFGLAAYNQEQQVIRIHTLLFKTNGELKYFMNGGVDADANSLSFDTAWGIDEITIGAAQNVGQYNGFIAEIILFKRNLLTEERRQIEGYLGKKYNIEIN